MDSLLITLLVIYLGESRDLADANSHVVGSSQWLHVVSRSGSDRCRRLLGDADGMNRDCCVIWRMAPSCIGSKTMTSGKCHELCITFTVLTRVDFCSPITRTLDDSKPKLGPDVLWLFYASFIAAS